MLIFAANLADLQKKIKVGIVSYLNTRPLIYGLKKHPIKEQIDLVEDNPAKLAEMLQRNEIDLGLIPVASIPTLSEYHITGKYCIAAEREVASVCLFSEVPMNQIKTVYLDYQSRSSVALLTWLMQEYWNIQPEIIQATNDSYREKIQGTTAGLVIGDRAFEQRRISTFIYDLSSEWRSITGLPFVFAAWVSNTPLPKAFIEQFDEANSIGFNHLDEIVDHLDYKLFDLKKYYTFHIQYLLDARKQKSMQMFLDSIQKNIHHPAS